MNQEIGKQTPIHGSQSAHFGILPVRSKQKNSYSCPRGHAQNRRSLAKKKWQNYNSTYIPI
jgi:hypothetical protein